MTTTIPNIETYPKHFLLRDGTAVTLRPLVKEDQIRLLEFFRRVPEGERYYQVIFELVAQREKSAITAAESVGFREVAVLKGWVRDILGEEQDLIIMEMPLKDYQLLSWY